MRNTAFKTAMLAGLFSCLLALAVVFFGTADFVHATHDEEPSITADQVETEAQLEQFVKEAVDAYYIDFIMKHHCDFTGHTITVPGFGTFDGQTINALLPGLPTSQIKGFIPQFSSIALEDVCDLEQPFHEVFGRADGYWKSGSIYLFIMNDQGEMLYHGTEPSVEGTTLDARDADGRDVLEEITDEIETPSNAGIVRYCWDDPTVMNDDNRDENGNRIAGEAPGDSWKTSYVVDPFEYLGINPPMGSPGVIFGSGIYPKTGAPPSGCRIVTDDEPEPMEPEPMEPEPMEPEPMEPEPMEPEPMEPEPMEPEEVTSVSGGGCAIAAGSSSTPRNNAFNLLLIVSALLFTVSFGGRAVSRRNDIRS